MSVNKNVLALLKTLLMMKLNFNCYLKFKILIVSFFFPHFRV